jgi:hypothetical protein
MAVGEEISEDRREGNVEVLLLVLGAVVWACKVDQAGGLALCSRTKGNKGNQNSGSSC